MAKADLTAQRLRELLHYNQETGAFTWLKSQGRQVANRVAGYSRPSGYIDIRIDGCLHLAHRLAWLYHYGKWPKNAIDHIDGCKGNNQISNLRDVVSALNNQNQRKAHSDSRSGFLGVSKYRNRWRSSIQVDGNERRVGTFDTAEQAHSAYLDAKRKIHPACTI